MGQFILLPDLKLLVVNGGLNGTAGYSQQTGQTPSFNLMLYGESLASGPVGTPAIYDPNAAQGSRWSNAGFGTSNIARLYHSSAMLLPDASVLIAGSNPNIDVNTSAIYPTTYQAEIFYPAYFSAKTRPAPTGMPQTLSYGGNSFDLTIPASSYSGGSNDAAASAMVTLLRGGFTTHAMNMGQRAMQLRNTFTVNTDGSIILHVAQPPPNPYIFQPGPGFLYVVINGVPSNGSYVIVGNGQIGPQSTASDSTLPDSVRADASTSGSGEAGTNGRSNSTSSNKILIIGGIVGAIAVLGLLGALIGIMVRRKRAAEKRKPSNLEFAMSHSPRFTNGGMVDGSAGGMVGVAGGGFVREHSPGFRNSDSSAFLPLKHDNTSMAWEQHHPPGLSYDGRASSSFRESEETFRGYAPPHSPTKQPILYAQSPPGSNYRL
jgi:hypothetical protein